MKLKLFYALVVIFSITSCIKDEPLNREADITDIKVDENLFIAKVISEGSGEIQIFVTPETDITSLVPEITVTPGAIISPESGIAQNFTNGVEYTVTSEDRNFSKKYTVYATSKFSLNYDFEVWGEGDMNGRKYPLLKSDGHFWSSGNSGVAIVKNADPYPTDYTNIAYSGEKGAILQTISGIKAPSLNLDIPIFAGSLFIGDFKPNLNYPLLSLQLGRIYSKNNGKPKTFTGYYKYTPGAVFIDKNGNPVSGKTDEFSIYAVIFRVTKGSAGREEFLDGETVKNSEKVIARAEWSEEASGITDDPVDKGFIKFTIPFKYTSEFDYGKYDYKMSIVLSSSKDGNLYEGAIGSTLIIDEMEIVTEDF